ncbi:thioredoxin family protein [Trinickia sp. NRRL B-1857]|uniref:thioredoxin family protein n=1 Tax=Trinickia sp. NRRL B-1857 TaxID=3162879 RepID=UPI003D28D5E8
MRIQHVLIGALLSATSLCAFAKVIHFDAQTYDQLRHEGTPFIVHTDATWCPICKKQNDLLTSIEQEPRFRQLTVLVVDVDADKEVMKSLDLSKRSLFIVYKGDAELGHSMADTDKDSIESLFAKAR